MSLLLRTSSQIFVGRTGWIGVLSTLSLVLIAASAAGQIVPLGTDKLFDQPVYYSLGMGQPVDSGGDATFGDFNADGLIDIAFGSGLGQLGVSMGTSMASFGAAVMTQVTSGGTWNELKVLAAGDFDLDGDIDVVGHDLAGIRLMLNDGAGGFTALPAYLPNVAYWTANGLTAFDADGDGAMDVLLGDGALSGGRIHVISYSAASGGLYTKSLTVIAANRNVEQIGGADIDGDGIKDIVSIVYDYSFTPYVYELWVHGVPASGGLTLKYSATQSALGVINIVGMFLGDFDANGVEDVIIQTINSLKLFYGVAGGSLTPGPATNPYLPANVLSGYAPSSGGMFGQSPRKCLAKDFDLDGVVDIGVPGFAEWMTIRSPAVGPVMNGNILYFLGLGNAGSLQAQLRLHSTYAKDLDGDGDLDLIDVTNRYPAELGFPNTGVGAFAHYGILWNRTNRHAGCASTSTGLAPTLTVGTPVPGNAAWTMSIAGAVPGAPVAFALSLEPGASTWGGCNLWLDASPSTLVLPQGNLGLTTADATGLASITLSIPAAVGPLIWIKNLELFGAAITADSQGSLTIGGVNYTSTSTRGVLIW